MKEEDWIKIFNSKICNNCGLIKWKEKEGKQQDLKVLVHTHNGGLHWVFENSKGEKLSVICHSGSYGRENGLFEIMPDWEDEEIKKWNDSVEGFLTFGDVQNWINKLQSRTLED